MVYDLIMESGEYALILRGSRMKEYAVVNGLDKAKGSWAWTCTYYNFGEFSPLSQAEALAMAVDYFRLRTESDYIGRNRLEELATRFKDCINGDEDFENVLDEMDDCEKEFFGIESEETNYEQMVI